MSNNDGAEKKDKKKDKWMDGKYHAWRYQIKDGKMEIYIDDEKLDNV
ncbi:MAG: hypothetical protein ACHQ1D_06590 [Nitrososphaerales archaeon]|jgi:hypothetical protein